MRRGPTRQWLARWRQPFSTIIVGTTGVTTSTRNFKAAPRPILRRCTQSMATIRTRTTTTYDTTPLIAEQTGAGVLPSSHLRPAAQAVVLLASSLSQPMGHRRPTPILFPATGSTTRGHPLITGPTCTRAIALMTACVALTTQGYAPSGASRVAD